MNCLACGAENPASNRFCDSCGTKLQVPKERPNEKPKEKRREPQPIAPAVLAPAAGRLETPLVVPEAVLRWFTWENLAWLAIFSAAVLIQFLNLGMKPLHHDESLHAYYAWELFKGMGYEYNPMMHGPFLFHSNALIYFLFGASDYTCRILPAVAALVCVFMAYKLKPYLGTAGALFTGLLIALSPSFTYYGRFIRNDIYIAADNLMMVYGFFRYLDTRKPKYLYLVSAALALSFATKEVTYITVAIFSTFLFFRWLWEYTVRQTGETQLMDSLTGLLKERRPLWTTLGIGFGIVFILYTTVFTHLGGFVDAFTKSFSYWLGQHEVQRGSQPVYFYLALLPLYETLAVIGTLAAVVYYGFVRWTQNRAWRLLAILIIGSAWWLFSSQGHEAFGLVFSLLLVCLGTGMLAYFSFGEKNLFVPFLLLYTFAAISDYSFAGERMPWLILHPLLPMVLLAGHWLGDLWDRFQRQRGWLLAGAIPLFALMLHGTSMLNFYVGGANPAEPLVYVQSSIDVPQVVRQLTNMSQRLTGGLEMKITCEDYCSWPFAWYLRDFKNVGYPKYTATQPEGSIEQNPVIISGVEMAAPGHDDRVAQLLAKDYVAQRYKLRVWWAPDAAAFFNDTFAGKLAKSWKLLIYREPWSGLGSYDMIVYLRKDVAHLYWSNAQ